MVHFVEFGVLRATYTRKFTVYWGFYAMPLYREILSTNYVQFFGGGPTNCGVIRFQTYLCVRLLYCRFELLALNTVLKFSLTLGPAPFTMITASVHMAACVRPG